jgi:hypothetical protein
MSGQKNEREAIEPTIYVFSEMVVGITFYILMNLFIKFVILYNGFMNLRRFPTKRKALRLELLVVVLLLFLFLGNVGAATNSPLENLISDLSVDNTARQRVKVVKLSGAIELHNYDFGDNSKASVF